MDSPHQSPLYRMALLIGCLLSCPVALSATDFVIIGGSDQQRRLVSCIAKASTELLPRTSDSVEPMTFVILEHHKFLSTRAAFYAYRTRLAFSNLAIGRIYLSTRILVDRDMALWGVGHELGHFVIRDGIEGHAEFAAERIRWRARQACW